MSRKKEQPLPMPVGTLVRYYDEGWRTGHFEGMKGTDALIRPVGPKGKVLRTATVPLSDVEQILK